MRMDPTDIADVTGSTYTYLVNGHGPLDNWTGLFRPGERVRLRVVNAAPDLDCGVNEKPCSEKASSRVSIGRG
jgi:hypothetical protein